MQITASSSETDLVGDHHSNAKLVCKPLQRSQELAQIDLALCQRSSAAEFSAEQRRGTVNHDERKARL